MLPIFELIVGPDEQPRRDGGDNLAWPRAWQFVRRAGGVLTMTLTRGSIRENHVTESEEGRRIAWMPAEPRQQRPGNYGGGNSNRPVRHGLGHLHLRQDRTDRQEPLSAGHHRQPTAGPLDRLAALT